MTSLRQTLSSGRTKRPRIAGIPRMPARPHPRSRCMAAPSIRSSAVCASAIFAAGTSAAARSRNSYRSVRAAACTEPLASGELRRSMIRRTPSISQRWRTWSATSAEPSCSAWS